MDTEERTGFPIKDLLFKMLLLTIFMAVLLWVFPMPKGDDVNVNPLTDRIFSNNIKLMQDAATSYYTLERLPKELGGKASMTLKEMLDKKMILPFVDRDGNACSVDNSFVEITRMETEFILKVYLECGTQKDYILVNLGCNDMCFILDKEKEIAKDPEEEKTKKVVEYQYKKAISSSGWTGWGDWTDEKLEGDNIESKTRKLLKGEKWIPKFIYAYEYERTVTSNWVTGSWTTRKYEESETRRLIDKDYRYSTIYEVKEEWSKEEYEDSATRKLITADTTTETRTKWVPSSWTTTKYAITSTRKLVGTKYDDPVKKVEIRYLLSPKDEGYYNNGEEYWDPIWCGVIYSCNDGCYIGQYNWKYEVTTYTKYYKYETLVEEEIEVPYYLYEITTAKKVWDWWYLYETKAFADYTETKMFEKTPSSEWKATGYKKMIRDAGDWDITDDWLEELPEGYKPFDSKTQYSYRYWKEKNSYEYKWSTKKSLEGWEKTGKTRSRTITL